MKFGIWYPISIPIPEVIKNTVLLVKRVHFERNITIEVFEETRWRYVDGKELKNPIYLNASAPYFDTQLSKIITGKEPNFYEKGNFIKIENDEERERYVDSICWAIMPTILGKRKFRPKPPYAI